MPKKIIYASDYRGIELRDQMVEKSSMLEYEFEDIGIVKGSSLDYIDICKMLAEELRVYPEAIGIMICGSGQGVGMALNRYTHMRAGMCRTVEDARQIREKLNANTMCLGSKYTDLEQAMEMLEIFLITEFKDRDMYAVLINLWQNLLTIEIKG
jgi:ribose 5-phosphate isomerase B